MDVRFGSIRNLLTSFFAGFLCCISAATEASESEPPEFLHLNYSRMSADEAFEGETLLVVMMVPVQQDPIRLPEPAQNPATTEPAAPHSGGNNSAQTSRGDLSGSSVTGTQPVPAAESKGPRSSQVAIRSLQNVNLFDATSPKAEDGKTLATPESVVSMSDRRVVEQFVPLPWHISHPPRNTFPFRHQPLYFEDPNLERCGESYGCLTEAVSIAHFAGRIPLLPYMMASDNPHKTVRALKDCPTGSSFGPSAYLPRPTVKAVAAEAAAVTGFIFVIP